MRKTQKKNNIPDMTEFTDVDGKKWIQTSTDDLFSLKELNDILESVEKEKAKGEVILARIDFQKVNREYYDAAVALQGRLAKQTDLLKKVIGESKKTIEKKNKKLKELINYIKKLHLFLTYLSSNESNLDNIHIPAEIMMPSIQTEEVAESVYEAVDEVILRPGEEKEKTAK